MVVNAGLFGTMEVLKVNKKNRHAKRISWQFYARQNFLVSVTRLIF